MLVTVSEQCDQKIMSLREEEKQGKLQMYRNKTNLHYVYTYLECIGTFTVLLIELLFIITEIVDLKKENQRLYKRIDGLRQEQVSLETQVCKMKKFLSILIGNRCLDLSAHSINMLLARFNYFYHRLKNCKKSWQQNILDTEMNVMLESYLCLI